MLKDRVAIVTGASIGIGKATAIELAKNGAKLCIVDIDENALKKTEEELVRSGATVSAFVCDVSDEKYVHTIVEKIISLYGKVDILVNNAGIWRDFTPFTEMESSKWDKFININIKGVMYFSQAVLENMIHNKYGRIINIGSVAGVYGNANMAVYSMTKGAVSSFTKALAKEVAEYGITVNNVVPGNVKNEGSDDNLSLSFMNRSGKLEEFAYLINFLASDKAAFISGQDYLIDGCRKKM